MQQREKYQRLIAMRELLRQIQKIQPKTLMQSQDRFICCLIDRIHRWGQCTAQARDDLQSLIYRALGDAYTYETWFRTVNGRDMRLQEAIDIRLQWVEKLIRDCNKEIEQHRC